MSRKHVAMLITALGIAASSLVQAHGRHDDHGHDPRPLRHEVHRHPGHGADRTHEARRGPAHPAAHASSWHRGDRVPHAYRSRHHVVNDWRGHHLRRPPAGHHWVQAGADYLLVAVATGIIAQVVLAH